MCMASWKHHCRRSSLRSSKGEKLKERMVPVYSSPVVSISHVSTVLKLLLSPIGSYHWSLCTSIALQKQNKSNTTMMDSAGIVSAIEVSVLPDRDAIFKKAFLVSSGVQYAMVRCRGNDDVLLVRM
jgi:hypothetical protein